MRDQYIWIIGASHGIGREVAQQLELFHGANVAITSRDQKALDAILPERNLQRLAADVTNAKAFRGVYDTLLKTWPRIDKVIYAAGIYTPTLIENASLTDAKKTMNVNFYGVLTMLDMIVPYFKERQAGHIVLIGSVAGYRGLPNSYCYGASKAALNHLAETLAMEMKQHHIKTQLVCPGFVKTRLTEKNDFPMPAAITAEAAAAALIKGMNSSTFEIHFPKRFTYVMKCLALLPNWLYLPLIRYATLTKNSVA